MIYGAVEILRVIREESFLVIPSTDNTERRERCNELIQSMKYAIEADDAKAAAAMSADEIADALQSGERSVLLDEAARRLRETGDSPEAPK